MSLTSFVTSPEGDAQQALRAFFRGFGFSDAATLGRLAQAVLGGLDTEAASPGTVREAAEARVASWFAPLFEPLPRERLLASARLAFLTSAAALRWPDAFLSEDAVPPEMVAALRRCLPRPTPPISPCTMPTQPLTPAVWIQRIQQLLPAPEDAQGSWNSQA